VIKNLIKLAVFLLLANALYQTAPVWVHYYQFKDAVKEMALFSKDASEASVVDRVMELAGKHKVPLERDSVQVARTKDHLFIEGAYVEVVKVVPGYEYRWPFEVSVDVWHVENPHGLGK
jgi:hypothetical protein